MKRGGCAECGHKRFHRDKIERTKYITRGEAKRTDDGRVVIEIEVGLTYLGNTYRVVIEELPPP